MNALRIGFKSCPKETKIILRKINSCDKKINKLLKDFINEKRRENFNFNQHNNEVYIIAEMSGNHNQSFENAIEIISLQKHQEWCIKTTNIYPRYHNY